MLSNNLSKTAKKLVIIAMAVVATFCFMVSAQLFGRANALEATLTNVTLQESYTVGTEIDLPIGTVTVGGTEYQVSPVIYYPDGSAYSLEKAVLEQKGKYTVEYAVEVDGTNYSVKKEFVASAYVFSNSASGQPFKYVETDAYSGIEFDVRPNEIAQYNKIIDVSKLTKDDTLIKFDSNVKEVGAFDADKVVITIADVYDASNYITINVKRDPDAEGASPWSYVTAGHGENFAKGYDESNMSEPFVEPTNYGHGFRTSLGNYVGDEQPPFDFRLDYESKQLWSFRMHGTTEVHQLIIDLDDDFGSDPWQGFTTGEVMISIYATNYVTNNAALPYNGVLLALAGQDLKAGISKDGTVGATTVTSAPAPSVDFGEYESANNIPNAMVGYEYPVFDAKIVSIYGGEKLSTHVYYGYNTSSRYELNVVDGKFTPDIKGLYTIVYQVTDLFGNVAQTTVDVEAFGADYDDIAVTVDGYENYDYCAVGEIFNIIGKDGVKIENAIGKTEISITAKHVQSGTVVNADSGKFTADRGGQWLITYSVVDYVGRPGSFEYVAEVELSNEVTFAPGNVDNFLNYIVVGAKNPVPETTYVDYNVGPESIAVAPTKLVDENDQKVADIVDGYVTPTAAGKYYVVYEATSAVDVTSKKKVAVTAVDVGFKDTANFNIGKYFYSDDITEYKKASREISFQINANGVADFIRPVNVANFRLNFNIEAASSAASAVVLYLTDINNADQKVRIQFNVGSGLVTINDRQYNVPSFAFGGNVDCSVSIKANVFSVGRLTVNIPTYLNGEKFNGFDSMLANMSLEVVCENAGSSKIIVKEVGNQKFYNISASSVERLDTTLPEIVSIEVPSTILLVNEQFKIAKSIIHDIIDPYAVGTLSVLDANGNALKDDNGVTLKNVATNKDYFITPDKTGVVEIVYDYADSTKSKEGDSSEVSIISRDAPTITIEGGDRTGKVGKEFTVGTATVSGTSENADLYVYVRPMVGRMRRVDATNKYKPTLAGEYKVIFVAMDEWGNMATAEYTVKVS